MFNKTQLIEALKSEGSIPIDDWILDRLISSGTEMTVPAKGYIIADGEIDKSLYITASGVTKAYFFDGKKESVLGFSGEGTMTLSPLCMILGRPAFCGFQAVTDCTIIKIEKKDFDSLMHESHAFALFMFRMAVSQLSALELKAQMLSEGDVYANYKKMTRRKMKLDNDGFDPNRPDQLINIVSSKDIASYLGITQSYLSNIRKAIHQEEKYKSK